MKRIRGFLSLFSIQSTPLTVVSLLLGYITVSDSILTSDVVPLIVAGALGHWAYYAANDVFDYEWDYRDNRTGKPLVSGLVRIRDARYMSLFLGVLSLAVVIGSFPALAIITWVLAMVFGLLYNINSKEDTYSGFYLGGWGFVIIITGALYTGDLSVLTLLVSILLAVHMLWMTVMGDLKDIGKEEDSIPELLDCKIIHEDGYRRLWTSARFNIVASVMVISQIVLLMVLPIGDGAHVSDIAFIYGAFAAAVIIWQSFLSVIYQPGFDRDRMKMDIAQYEIISATSILLISISFAEYLSIVLLVLGTVIWGTVWQTVLYKHPLRFP